jgi:ABC-type transport system substrate-binding protein
MATAASAAGLGMGLDFMTADPSGALTNGPGRNGVARGKPKRGGQLVFGVDAEEQGFDPTSGRFDEVGVMYARTVFDPLTTVTPNGQVVPYLAKSVVPNADYTQWTITLRSGVMFHDGTPCDAAALLYNLQAQYHSLLVGPVLQPVVEATNGFVQTGPLTVQVNLKSPWIPFPYYLAGQIGGQIGYVAAPSMLKNKNGTTHPIGTGPFMFKEWVANDHFTAVRNPHYWRKGLPYLGSIEFRPIPDAASRSESLQAGTIDIMITDTPQEVVKFRGNRSYSYIDDSGVKIGEPDMNCVLLNLAQPPFNDASVRLAAAKALSSKQYAKTIDINVNPPTNGLFVPGSPYFAKTNYPKYDPTGAKHLVAQAKAAGKSVSFTFGTTPSPSAVRSATYLQNAFQAVGFQVTQATFQQNDLINNALSGKFQAQGWRQFSAVNPDMNYIFWSTTTYSANNISINMARNNNPKVEQALLTGRSSQSAAARVAAYQQVNSLFAQDLPYLWNDRAVWALIANTHVQNFANPTAPSGAKSLPFFGGSAWPTQIWKT